jgi:serine/threonine protein kinase
LITKGGVCKLADFGVATKLEAGVKSLSAVGTPYWSMTLNRIQRPIQSVRSALTDASCASVVAPEIFEGDPITDAADIWSLGCTVLELIDGKYPYAELGPMNAMFRIIEDPHPPFPEGISQVYTTSSTLATLWLWWLLLLLTLTVTPGFGALFIMLLQS